MTNWHDEDGFWRDVEPVIFSADRFGEAAQEVVDCIELMKVDEGAEILDMPTGPGRHALEFARLGYRVTGVDRTTRYLERARASAQQAHVDLDLVEDDMRNFVRPGRFDGAINLMTSIGYFDDESENVGLARNICRSLKPSGRAVFDMVGKEILAASYQEKGWMEGDDGVLVLEHRVVRDGWERMEGHWTLLKDGVRKSWTITHRLYSGTELRQLLVEAGFVQVTLLGSFKGEEYGPGAKRLVAVAHAPE